MLDKVYSRAAANGLRARRKMTKSSVRSKIILIAVSFSLPLGVLLYLTIANINNRIGFAAKELAGTAYLRPLAAVLEGVQ